MTVRSAIDNKQCEINDMVGVAQLVRASDCGSEGRGFKSPHSPHFIVPMPRVFHTRGIFLFGLNLPAQ
jgi:hypothetical protein